MGDNPEEEDGDDKGNGNDRRKAVDSLMVRYNGRGGAAMVFNESWEILLLFSKEVQGHAFGLQRTILSIER